MSLFRPNLFAVALALTALAGCADGSSAPEAPAPADAAVAGTPADAAPAPASVATQAAPDADMSGSWAFVAGSIYAGGKACGFAPAELDAYKAKAREKTAASGQESGFEAAFAQGIRVAEDDAGGTTPDARTCELTREAMARG